MTAVETLLSNMKTDASVHQVAVGAFWSAVMLDSETGRCGIASTLRGEHHHEGHPVPQAGRLLESGGMELASWLRSPSILEADTLTQVSQIRVEL